VRGVWGGMLHSLGPLLSWHVDVEKTRGLPVVGG
jgi:hypothetical protein